MAPPAPPRIKICGITRLEDAEHAVEAGAWALGFILWPGSRRAIALQDAADVIGHVRRRVRTVGVFVDATLDEVVGTAEALGLTHVQLHGHEGPIFADAVQHRAGVEVIKAAGIGSRADLQAMAAFRSADYHLLDAHVEGADAPGGNGRVWDHSLLKERRSPVPLILSGGLDAENVGAAIELVRPWGVDVASGTESAPGVKDPARVEAFVAAVRATAVESEPTDVEPEPAVPEPTAPEPTAPEPTASEPYAGLERA